MIPSPTDYQNILGWCSDGEAAGLQKHSAGLNVLEIGVWQGRSTVAMAAVAKSVFSVDHFLGDNFAGPYNTIQDALNNLHYIPNVYLSVGKWRQVVDFINLRNIGFIYYDADHTYEATKEFLDWVRPTKIPFGLHDVDDNPNHAGVKQALHEFTTDYHLYDRLAVCDSYA